MFAVCDRIENGIAVLVFDDESVREFSLRRLCELAGADVREADVLDVLCGGDSVLSARLDAAEKERRLNAARARLARLAAKDKNS
ncbi:MAG: DUF3006 family protein [Ruminococcaceae bacterium]|nr:DUF3006 family protein [Oscillospiraceae bacterium]